MHFVLNSNEIAKMFVGSQVKAYSCSFQVKALKLVSLSYAFKVFEDVQYTTFFASCFFVGL